MLSREQMFSLETTLMFAGTDSNTQQYPLRAVNKQANHCTTSRHLSVLDLGTSCLQPTEEPAACSLKEIRFTHKSVVSTVAVAAVQCPPRHPQTASKHLVSSLH